MPGTHSAHNGPGCRPVLCSLASGWSILMLWLVKPTYDNVLFFFFFHQSARIRSSYRQPLSGTYAQPLASHESDTVREVLMYRMGIVHQSSLMLVGGFGGFSSLPMLRASDITAAIQSPILIHPLRRLRLMSTRLGCHLSLVTCHLHCP